MDKWIKENKITSGIVLILIATLLLLIYRQSPKISLDTSDADLQNKCASQAGQFFEYLLSNPAAKVDAEYSNHFNSKLNKCFILVRIPHQNLSNAFNDGALYEKDLYDAVEKKQYARYAWLSSHNQNQNVESLVMCVLYPNGTTNIFQNSDEYKSCNPSISDFYGSESEFDSLVKSYMEN